MPRYSIVIPVFNRPTEVDELLESLHHQTVQDFEVLIIEDGSDNDCKHVVKKHEDRLTIRYFYKENSGQGFSRNFGYERAHGEWMIVFDSDCIIPPHYLQSVEDYLAENAVDAFGGPDRAHENFTPVQKAISYSMTSLFTTGGIRGGKKHIGVFHPRSFNMGIRKAVFEKTGGYVLPKKGEDIEFSIRIIENGFKTALIEDAYVYHKRRTHFRQFFRQLHFFGTARINIFRHYPAELKWMHFFPSVFTLGWMTCLILLLWVPVLGLAGISVYVLYFLLILIDASVKSRSVGIGLLSVCAAFIQLTAYGLGLLQEGLLYLRKVSLQLHEN